MFKYSNINVDHPMSETVDHIHLGTKLRYIVWLLGNLEFFHKICAQ